MFFKSIVVVCSCSLSYYIPLNEDVPCIYPFYCGLMFGYFQFGTIAE